MGFDVGEILTKGFGGLLGGIGAKLANWIPGREERRRNAIDKLETRQRFIEVNRRNDLAAEYDRNKHRLKQLYADAKNS